MGGGLAASMLADYGATVIKIEKPGVGNSLRQIGPFIDGVSLIDSRINRGKQSVELDLDDKEDCEIAKKLAASCDVVIEDFTPGVMAGRGLGYHDIEALRKDVIYCSVTPFGQTGPYAKKRANELTIQAYSGTLGTTGDKQPQMHGFYMSDFAAGQSAYGSIVAALCYRLNSGEGQHIDVSNTRSLVYLNSAVERLTVGVFAGLEGNHHPTIAPFGIFNGNDGGVVICALNAKLWNNLCDLMGKPEFKEDERFVTVQGRATNRLLIAEYVEEWLKQFPSVKDALVKLAEANVPVALINTTEDVINDAHVKATGWLVEAPMPEGSTKPTFFSQGMSFSMSGTPGQAKAAPKLGASTQQIFKELGVSRAKA